MTLNNPLVLIAGQLFGIGFSIRYEKFEATKKICFQVDVIAWSYCKEFGNAG